MAEHLTAAQFEQLKAALLEQRARLLERGGLQITDDYDAEPMDIQEEAVGEVARRDRLALTDMDRTRLLEVQFALTRMSDGSYGECEESGDPIPFVRLVAEPTTRYTVEAQELVESDTARAKAIARKPHDVGY